jgi:hypothetical protein
VKHWGGNNGELLDPGTNPNHPDNLLMDAPDPIQDGQVSWNGHSAKFDIDCFAEQFLFGEPTLPTGAIAYLGARTGGRPFGRQLIRHFFEAYEQGEDILGEMWRVMIEEYYQYYGLAGSDKWRYPPYKGDADWGHKLDEPQKYILFGDPSLVVGGAFAAKVSGTVSDDLHIYPAPVWHAYFASYTRYRVVGNVVVAAGTPLSAHHGASILFASGKKMTAPNSSDGFHAMGTADAPVCLLSSVPQPCSNYAVRGVKIYGQMRLRNGGEIKLSGAPVTGCFSSAYSTYNDWVVLGRPNCWCERFQCDGDADGSTETFFKYRVYGNDLGLIVANWKRKIGDPLLDPCADIDHKAETFFGYRVYGKDLGKIVANWKKKDSQLPGNCPRPE